MMCPTCGGQLPTVVLQAVGGFLAVPFVVFVVVLVLVRRALRPPSDRP